MGRTQLYPGGRDGLKLRVSLFRPGGGGLRFPPDLRLCPQEGAFPLLLHARRDRQRRDREGDPGPAPANYLTLVFPPPYVLFSIMNPQK